MTLISEFLFSTKESTISGSKKLPHHVLTLHAMRNSKKSIFAGPRIDLMSTTKLFYIVKVFGLIKRGMTERMMLLSEYFGVK
jgi:hypothetical protein